MSKVRQQGGRARRGFATTRESLGDFFRGLASRRAVEWKSEGGSAVFTMRHGVSTPDASVQGWVDSFLSVSHAYCAGLVGGVIRRPVRRNVEAALWHAHCFRHPEFLRSGFARLSHQPRCSAGPASVLVRGAQGRCWTYAHEG